MFSKRGPKTKALARSAGGAGFSLVEVVIAGAIAVVGILGLMSLFPVSSGNLVASASTTAAVGLGAQRIETMGNLPFASLILLPSPGNDTQTLGGITYNRTWTVTVNGAAPNRTATITTTITWPGMRNANGFAATTILAE